MPELPEVETVKRFLATIMINQRIASVQLHRSGLRQPFPPSMSERIAGNQVHVVRRLGKYMLLELSSCETLIIHLGMSGSFALQTEKNRTKVGRHDHVVFVIENGTRAVFSDPRRFGLMDLAPTDAVLEHPLIARLGIEPLSPEFNAQWLSTALKARRMPIKSALLNQGIVAGLGNIYVCEALWRAGISPRRQCNRIALRRIQQLTVCIKEVLREAITVGGSTLRDHRRPQDGTIGYFQHHFSVYSKTGIVCPRAGCRGKIVRIVQSGRSTFYCRTCQT